MLTSVVFAVSVLRLSRYKTLVQDLYCTESLARVDVLCLDKTGTITEGTMQVDELHPLTGYTEEDMTAPLKALVQVLTDDNPTYNAVKAYFPGGSDWKAAATVPFEVGDARVGDRLVNFPEVSPSVTSGDLPGEGPGSPTYTETDKQ